MVEKIGVVIASDEGPSPSRVDFVVTRGKIHQGQFVEMEYEEGVLLALVEDVQKANRYFENAEIVKEYEIRSSLSKQLPAGEWEFLVGISRPLVVLQGNRMLRPTYPPSPGTPVFEPSAEDLKRFLGLEEQGIHIGKLQFHNVDVRLNMDELVQKHFAILAMSGAGKSYLTSVIIEELLDRPPEVGRIGVVVFDVHGEYRSFAEPPSDPKYVDYSDRATVVPAGKIRIGVSNLSPSLLTHFLPGLTHTQIRTLRMVIHDLRREMEQGRGPYTIEDIMNKVETDPRIGNPRTREALIAWLQDLRATNLFADVDSPSLYSLVRPGRLVIFDLSEILDMRRKQLIVAYLAHRLFSLRREGRIPPTLVVVEEAHQFVPEGVSEAEALARPIIETIAREGRKFGLGLCLISQRPVRLSTTALSQCNTHIILRVTNPYDLDHIKKSSEGIDERSARMITVLRTGEALIVGAAVHFPVFVRVRERRSQPSKLAKTITEMAKEFEEQEKQIQSDLDAL